MLMTSLVKLLRTSAKDEWKKYYQGTHIRTVRSAVINRGTLRTERLDSIRFAYQVMALGYAPDIRDLFGTPKFDTMEELELIRRKGGDKRAYPKNKKR